HLPESSPPQELFGPVHTPCHRSSTDLHEIVVPPHDSSSSSLRPRSDPGGGGGRGHHHRDRFERLFEQFSRYTQPPTTGQEDKSSMWNPPRWRTSAAQASANSYVDHVEQSSTEAAIRPRGSTAWCPGAGGGPAALHTARSSRSRAPRREPGCHWRCRGRPGRCRRQPLPPSRSAPR